MIVGYFKHDIVTALHLSGPLVRTKSDGRPHAAIKSTDSGGHQSEGRASGQRLLQVSLHILKSAVPGSVCL